MSTGGGQEPEVQPEREPADAKPPRRRDPRGLARGVSVRRSVPGPAPPGRAARPTLRHVLVCLDGSPLSEHGIPHAFALASCLGARLTLLRVLECPHGTPQERPLDALDWEIERAEAGGHLESIVEQGAARGLRVDTEILEGPAAEQICAYARAHDVDLTVLTTHGRAGISEWALASTASKVIESVCGSVLIVPTGAARAADVRYERLLVPLDVSARAECVLPLAIEVATAQDGEVILAHVVRQTELIGPRPLSPDDVDLERRLRARNRRVAGRYLAELKGRYGVASARIRTVLAHDGDTHQQIEDLARRERIDLLILSAHGKTGSCERPYGSVAKHVLTHASGPVLVVQDLSPGTLNRIRATRANDRAPVRPHGGVGQGSP